MKKKNLIGSIRTRTEEAWARPGCVAANGLNPQDYLFMDFMEGGMEKTTCDCTCSVVNVDAAYWCQAHGIS